MFIYCDGFPAYEGIPNQIMFKMGGYTLADNHFRILKREYRSFDAPQHINRYELWAIAEAIMYAGKGDTVVSDSFNMVDVVNWCKLHNFTDQPDIAELVIRLRLRMYLNDITLKWERRDGNPAGAINEHFPVRKLKVKSDHEVFYFYKEHSFSAGKKWQSLESLKETVSVS